MANGSFNKTSRSIPMPLDDKMQEYFIWTDPIISSVSSHKFMSESTIKHHNNKVLTLDFLTPLFCQHYCRIKLVIPLFDLKMNAVYEPIWRQAHWFKRIRMISWWFYFQNSHHFFSVLALRFWEPEIFLFVKLTLEMTLLISSSERSYSYSKLLPFTM